MSTDVWEKVPPQHTNKIHTTKITAVSVSKDAYYVASFNQLDSMISLWHHPAVNTNSNTNSTLIALWHHNINSRTNSTHIVCLEDNILDSKEKGEGDNINTEESTNDEPNLTISTKQLQYDKQKGHFIILSSSGFRPIILFKDMEQSSLDLKNVKPACLKDVKCGKAEFLSDGETLVIHDDKNLLVVSVSSWPWILRQTYKLNENVQVQAFTCDQDLTHVQPKYRRYVVLLWKNILDVVDIDSHQCCLHIMLEEVKKINNMHIVGNLLAILDSESLHVYNLETGLTVMDKKLVSDDFQFVNYNKYLLIICKKDEKPAAIMYDAHTGMELISVELPIYDFHYIHIFTDGRLVAVELCTDNNISITEWGWKNAFCKQSNKYPDVIANNIPVMSEDSVDDNYLELITKDPNGSSSGLNPTEVIKIDEESIIIKAYTKAIYLFYEAKNDIGTQRLVWKMPESRGCIKNVTYQCVDNLSNKAILRFNITCNNDEMCILLPIDAAICGNDLPDEWMQYDDDFNDEMKTAFLNLLKQFKQHTRCNIFNSSKTMCHLIQCIKSEKKKDSSEKIKIVERNYNTAIAILEEILTKDNYKPAIGIHTNDNPFTVECMNPKVEKLLVKYCIHRCIKDGQPGFMSAIVNALPWLAKHNPNILVELMRQCTYVKVPNTWGLWKLDDFNSTKENLWGTMFDGSISMIDCNQRHEWFRLAKINKFFDKWETILQHPATDCYVPLPGLCTYPDSKSNLFNTLIPHHLSPFAKLAFLNSFEVFNSIPFEAIVKYKWHTFARWHYFGLLFIYLIHFGVFVAAITTTIMSNNPGGKLMTASISIGVILAFGWIRRAVIYGRNTKDTRIYFITAFSTYIDLAAFVLPVVTGFLELGDNTATSELRSLSILSIWILIITKLRAFKGIGVFIVVVARISRKILWLLLLLAFILFAFAHSIMIYLFGASPDKPDNGPNTFTGLDQSLKNIWSMLLSDYSSINPWPDNYLLNILKIAFSFSTTIVLLNVLIALMNSVYSETYENAHSEWVMQRAKIIADIEISWMTPSGRQNRNNFPWTIFYEGFTEKVHKWRKDLENEKILVKDNPSNKENSQDLQNNIKDNPSTKENLQDLQNNIINELEIRINKMKVEMDSMSDELMKLRQFF